MIRFRYLKKRALSGEEALAGVRERAWGAYWVRLLGGLFLFGHTSECCIENQQILRLKNFTEVDSHNVQYHVQMRKQTHPSNQSIFDIGARLSE